MKKAIRRMKARRGAFYKRPEKRTKQEEKLAKEYEQERKK